MAQADQLTGKMIEGFNTEAKSIFKIVIIHENLATGVGASAIMGRLADQLKGEPEEITNDVWRFELLLRPELYEQAMASAIEADMIIVSVARGNDLPEYVKDWLESVALQKKGGSSALLALMDWDQNSSHKPKMSVVGSYLEQLAERTGLDFYWNGNECRPQFLPLMHPIASQVESDYLPMANDLPRNSGLRGWGIND